jgi:TRAP-type mannitol/chloroaromatic compound transport system permease large subunit
MGMGMIFTWLAYETPPNALDLMVQAAFKTMSSDVLIAIPLFVFMGYLVERASLIEKFSRTCTLRWRAYAAHGGGTLVIPPSSRPQPASVR